MTVAAPARPARKPSAAQLRVLRRMIGFREFLHVSAISVDTHDGQKYRLRVPYRTYTALRKAGLIEAAPAPMCAWRVSDAGRRAAE
jgi:hypothetical protein